VTIQHVVNTFVLESGNWQPTEECEKKILERLENLMVTTPNEKRLGL
jgi:hypothetical protein